jgi:hypothetical protein
MLMNRQESTLLGLIPVRAMGVTIIDNRKAARSIIESTQKDQYILRDYTSFELPNPDIYPVTEGIKSQLLTFNTVRKTY